MEEDNINVELQSDFVNNDDSLPKLISDSDDELTDYYFESDPLALQMDSDYQKLLRALVKLQNQRTQAINDLETIQDIREKGVKDPIGFVNELLAGKHKHLPGPIKIEPIPMIDLDKYDIGSFLEGNKPKTRKRKPENKESSDEDDCSANEKIFVRGREFNESKPSTFNQPWTDEEQRRLDELLIKYPDERIASQRYLKISKELGTRTVVQVQSRVQKYFVALKREGLPVPGRAPRSALVKKIGGRRRLYPNMSSYESDKSMSYMQAFNFNSSSDQVNEHIKETMSDLPQISDEEDIVPELHATEEYKEIQRIRRVKKLKIKETETQIIKHYGFSCDICNQMPIIGTRWHCTECPDSVSTDFCDKCIKNDYSNSTHLPNHTLKQIQFMSLNDTLQWLRDLEQ